MAFLDSAGRAGVAPIDNVVVRMKAWFVLTVEGPDMVATLDSVTQFATSEMDWSISVLPTP